MAAAAAAHPELGGETIVGATGVIAGRAGVGGAHVAATPAVWLVGAAGRTGGADFFLRRRLVLRYSAAAIRAATARMMSAYSTGIRWGASLLAYCGSGSLALSDKCVVQKYATEVSHRHAT